MSSSSLYQPKSLQEETERLKSPPPPYLSTAISNGSKYDPTPSIASQPHDPALNILREVDTIILVDDSGSMETYWEETGKALAIVAEEAAKYDEDGIEIRFLNSKEVGKKLRTKAEVMASFGRVRPRGSTPIGKALGKILDPYVNTLRIQHHGAKVLSFLKSNVKPINVLVLTDGAPTDNPKAVIARIARNLDKLQKPRNQVGLQFIQIGSDEEATEYLKRLDDNLSNEYGVRDMVDTVPTNGRRTLSGEQLIKILLGGLSMRFDEKASR